MKKLALALAAIAALSGPAMAADMMAVKARPMVAPVMTWTGFYAGINGGYSWGRRVGLLVIPPSPPPSTLASRSRRLDPEPNIERAQWP